jgi:hypothetical protein
MRLYEFDDTPMIDKDVEDAAFNYFPQRNIAHKTKNPVEMSTQDTELRAKLSKLGWHYLNDGHFSAVFTNDKKPFVLKINKSPDKGFEHYATLIKDFDNVHFPKIGDMKVMNINGRKFYIYLIEKLSALGRDNGIDTSTFFRIIQYPTRSLEELYPFGAPVPYYLKNDPSLVDALRLVGKYMEGFLNDMGRSNVMQRSDGTIVITDPYAVFSYGDTNREPE